MLSSNNKLFYSLISEETIKKKFMNEYITKNLEKKGNIPDDYFIKK